MSRCSTGKLCHSTYAEALAALMRVEPDPLRGSVYTCTTCGEFHVSKRRFMLEKKKGRGKGRSGIVFRWSA
jgi:hypothetical protein